MAVYITIKIFYNKNYKMPDWRWQTAWCIRHQCVMGFLYGSMTIWLLFWGHYLPHFISIPN